MMKSVSLLHWLNCLLLGAVLAMPVLHAEPADRAEPPPRVAERLQPLAEKLELTDVQKTRIAEILQNQRVRLEAIQQDEELSRRQKIKKLRDLREIVRLEIRAQLTPEQQKTFDRIPRERLRK